MIDICVNLGLLSSLASFFYSNVQVLIFKKSVINITEPFCLQFALKLIFFFQSVVYACHVSFLSSWTYLKVFSVLFLTIPHKEISEFTWIYFKRFSCLKADKHVWNIKALILVCDVGSIDFINITLPKLSHNRSIRGFHVVVKKLAFCV